MNHSGAISAEKLFIVRYWVILPISAVVLGVLIPHIGLLIPVLISIVLGCVLLLRNPGTVLILLIGLLPLFPPEAKIDLGLSLTFDRVMILLFLSAIIFSRRTALLHLQPLSLPLWQFFLLLSFVLTASLVFSENPLETSFENMYLHYTGFLVLFGSYLAGSSDRWRAHIDALLVGTGVLTALIGVAETIRGRYLFAADVEHFRGTLLRAKATLENPIPYGIFLTLVLPLAVFRALDPHKRPLTRILWGGAACCILGGISVSFSRQAYLSVLLILLVSIAVLIGQRLWDLRFIVMIGFLIASVLVGVAISSNHVLTDLFFSGDAADNIDSRLHMSMVALTMLYENPLFGVGLGNFRYRAYDYQFFRFTKMPVNLYGEAPIVDNSYLTILAETGLIGGAIFLAMLISIIRHLLKSVTQNWRTMAFRQEMLCEGTVIGLFLFNGFMVDVFEYKVLTYIFWLMTGRLFLRDHRAPRQDVPNDRKSNGKCCD